MLVPSGRYLQLRAPGGVSQRKADVDTRRSQSFDLQLGAVLLNGCLIEFACRFVVEPDQEFFKCLRVSTPRMAGGEAIQYEPCDDSPSIVALPRACWTGDNCR